MSWQCEGIGPPGCPGCSDCGTVSEVVRVPLGEACPVCEGTGKTTDGDICFVCFDPDVAEESM